jgi:ABC-type antimicrobial peptide transport system, ATPase component
MLRLENISKIYGRGKNSVEALKNVNINFGESGLAVILGKSGSGKTSLLNILAGLDKPTSGSMSVCGKKVSDFSGAELDAYRNTYVGMVFQEFNLIDEISVYQNIEITLKLQRKSTDVNTVDEALSMVGLANLGYRKPSELSGGQRQRVALARALLKKPQILLADEPTGALDVSTSEEVFETLKKLSRDRLVIVVTHDRELAFAYGERIIEISDGQIISDKEMITDSFASVKSLNGSVLEVSAGGRIEPSDINKKLTPGVQNFVGISHDKDRVALAYPDTFDLFNLPKEKLKLRDTDQSRAESKTPFALKKGALKIKDAAKMARVNRKRAKKRFWFITVLNTVCFAILALGFILARVNMPDVIAKSAFDTHAQSLVAVTILRDSYNSDIFQAAAGLEEEDLNDIEEIAGGKELHKVYTMGLSPYYAVSEKSSGVGSIAQMFLSSTQNMDITLEKYTGIIEADDFSKLGLSAAAGSTVCANYGEIIISDFAAEKLVERGFFGKDAGGSYGKFFPSAASEIVGMSVAFVNPSAIFKIVGIYKTDYERYAYLHSAEERASLDSITDIRNFTNNKDFLYSKIFAKSGFTEENFKVDEDRADITFTGNYERTYNIDLNKFKYKAEYFDYPLAGDSFLWIDPFNTLTRTTPDSVARDFPNLTMYTAAVSVDFLQSVFPGFNPETDIRNEGGFPTLGYEYRYIYAFGMNLSIVAVFDSSNFEETLPPVLIDSESYNMFSRFFVSASPYTLTDVIFYRGDNFKEIKSLAAKLIANEYLPYSSVGSVKEILRLGDMFGPISKIFLYVAAGMAIFSFLLILNFMSSSVRFRAKEIAVYRVVGASRLDVAKIFLTESAILAFVSAITATVLGYTATYFIELSSKSALQIFNLSFSIVKFDLLTVPVIFGASAILVTIASLLPILSVTARKAIDALKVIG